MVRRFLSCGPGSDQPPEVISTCNATLFTSADSCNASCKGSASRQPSEATSKEVVHADPGAVPVCDFLKKILVST